MPYFLCGSRSLFFSLTVNSRRLFSVYMGDDQLLENYLFFLSLLAACVSFLLLFLFQEVAKPCLFLMFNHTKGRQGCGSPFGI